jgi:hypothetical protein
MVKAVIFGKNILPMNSKERQHNLHGSAGNPQPPPTSDIINQISDIRYSID